MTDTNGLQGDWLPHETQTDDHDVRRWIVRAMHRTITIRGNDIEQMPCTPFVEVEQPSVEARVLIARLLGDGDFMQRRSARST